MSTKTEYNASSTNSYACYSNVESYGAYGMVNPIVPPTPVTIQPTIFNLMCPHKMQSFKRREHAHQVNSCVPYRKLSDIDCKSCY
jgi:hypothetical protein